MDLWQSHGSPNTKSEDTAGHSGTGFNPAFGMWRHVDLYDFKTSLGHIVSLSLKQNKKQKQVQVVRKTLFTCMSEAALLCWGRKSREKVVSALGKK